MREFLNGDLHSFQDLSDDPNNILHQQTEAELISASHTRTRSKRCTCYSFKDRECVYYCHLGIIWINTPQRTVPYGMSSYRSPQRLRRSSGTEAVVLHRCTCADHNDAQCYDFCDARMYQTEDCEDVHLGESAGFSSHREPLRSGLLISIKPGT
ncbi:unnamed protein product [Leuciscus chuanchicus]